MSAAQGSCQCQSVMDCLGKVTTDGHMSALGFLSICQIVKSRDCQPNSLLAWFESLAEAICSWTSTVCEPRCTIAKAQGAKRHEDTVGEKR